MSGSKDTRRSTKLSIDDQMPFVGERYVEYCLKNNLPLPGEELPLDEMGIATAVSEYLLIMQNKKGRSRHTIATNNGTGERLLRLSRMIAMQATLTV